MEEKKQNPKERNLESKVYFLVYNKPMHIDEIGNIFYGEKKSYPQIISVLKKLHTNGFVEKITDIKKLESLLTEEEKEDRRHIVNRAYYQSNPKLLIEKIENKLKNEFNDGLDEEEKKILNYLLSHESFKNFIRSLLFRTKKDGGTIFSKEIADPDSVIQFLSFLCAYANIIIKIRGEKTTITTFPCFRRRFNNALSGTENYRHIYKHAKGRKDRKISNILMKYNKEISTKYINYLFPKEKDENYSFLEKMKECSGKYFFQGIEELGPKLLGKLAQLSHFEDIIKIMYIQATAVIVPSTFAHYNIQFPDDKEIKENPPVFLKPIISTLNNLRNDIESETRKQRHKPSFNK